MYKSNLCYVKPEKKNYPSGKAYNLLSPPLNPKAKPTQFFNSNIPKFKPIQLYSTNLSPMQNDKNFFVKNVCSPDDKLNQDLLKKFSNYQNLNAKMYKNPNLTNSDLLTVGSLTTQQSESCLSNKTNTNAYIPTTFQPVMNNYMVCQFPNHRYNNSITNYSQMNYFYGNNQNPFINGNYSNMNMKYNYRQSTIIPSTQKKNNKNMNLNTKYKKYSSGNYIKNKINNNTKNSNNNDDKIDVSNFNSNSSIKSGSGSEKSNTDSNKFSSNNDSNKSDSINGKTEKKQNNSNNCGNFSKKKYYNKFNSPKENNIANENTVILTLKIKVAPNDFRTFNLKKYDDLFISLEKFFDLNKIKQDLIKPTVTKIFAALNKIFWLLNNKIGIYDQEYLNSLHKLWIKNNGQIPKRNEDKKEEDTKSNNSKEGGIKKNKANSDKSTISSSDSSDGDKKKHKKIMSNSFQNMDNNSEDGKENTVNSIKSI